MSAILESPDAQLFAVTIKDLDLVIKAKEEEMTRDQELQHNETLVPFAYHNFLPMLSKPACNQGLPPHRYVDHEITLQPDAKPPFCPLYLMSPKELQVLKDYP
jgi:hypothetical protein